MVLLKIVFNLGKLLGYVKTVEAVIGNVVANKKLSKEDGIKLIEVARGLLDSGIIDIPGVDESQISAALLEVEKQL